jgi:transcriptional regulator with GAF, ATPase, and Fis domain
MHMGAGLAVAKAHETSHDGILGNSPAIEKVRQQIACYGPTDVSVLILGETGTGKELVAKALHSAHPARRNYKIISQNCTALPEGLIESELFGHERGSFTGAHYKKQGLFEKAHGGSFFLDEIGDASLAVQSKLLRTLVTKEVTPIGAVDPYKIDVRFIAATNIDLSDAIEQKQFRKDLYYRISTGVIRIPRLHERHDDVLLLMDHYLEDHALKYKSGNFELTGEAKEFLRAYEWPGNIRELEQVAERLVLIHRHTQPLKGLYKEMLLEVMEASTNVTTASADAKILHKFRTATLKELTSHTIEERIQHSANRYDALRSLDMSFAQYLRMNSSGAAAAAFTDDFQRIEIDVLTSALDECGWNRAKAARMLNMSIDRLQYRIEKYNLSEPINLE